MDYAQNTHQELIMVQLDLEKAYDCHGYTISFKDKKEDNETDE